jgi:predicted PurR-regulated permease PerM
LIVPGFGRSIPAIPRGGSQPDGGATITPHPQSTKRIAAVVLGILLALLALWMLRSFLPALVWALVIAIATWPLYRRFMRARGAAARGRALPAALFTLLLGLLVVLPLGLGAVEVGHETFGLLHRATAAAATGLPPPHWLAELPLVGNRFADWWNANLAKPGQAAELWRHINDNIVLVWARSLGEAIVHRIILFFFTLLALFFLFRDGAVLGAEITDQAERLLGARGRRLGGQLIAAVRATVNGLVLVGLGEGLAWGIGCLVAGVPHPLMVGALSGLLAIIPFGLPIAIFTVAGVMLAESQLAWAIALAVYGLTVVFIADHLVRPALISGAARLPFLWVLLGLLGGVETFGLVGLFLGPAVLAALMALWREWVAAPAAA